MFSDNPHLSSINLADFKITDLNKYLFETKFTNEPLTGSSKDFRIMFVGKDDVHSALYYILKNVRESLYLNMFGYDDEDLNRLVMNIVENPAITCLITLDKSQAGGVHEKRLLQSNAASDPVGYNTHFVIGESVTHQISHTKGFVADSCIGCEGSTNWSTSGEGTFVIKGKPGGKGYKAQNNTQTIFTCPLAVNRFQNELIAEHVAAQRGLLK